jgi:hypothetical protein
MKVNLLTIFLMIFSIAFSGCNNSEGEEKKVIYENLEDGETEPVQQKVEGTTQITFEETEHDFGTIQDGIMASHTFKFKNTGKSPLVITDARADCGCTVPSWTKEPVLPGKEGKIDVKYNSSGRGGQEVSKTVTVIANTEPADSKLTIKAKVLAKGGSPIKK